MGKVKEVIATGLEVLDGALEYVKVAENEPLQFGYSEAVSFYNGCKIMFEALTPGFEVEVVDGHHELKGGV
jgi:hypothetical protein